MNFIPIHPAAPASAPQIDLFGLSAPSARVAIEQTPEIEIAVRGQVPVFIAVSGGRDSQALASFDRGEREPGQSLMFQIYNILNLNKLR